jgi:3-hydroxy-9,10-secoandrosta-1,3,5(10)-triene-9,17-dione monooxygenase reductase component
VVSDRAFDSGEFRRALGAFATGVTIITTRAADGTPTGLTCSSFNSVSLNPPLVLWSLDNKAMSLPTFQAAPYFAVHVLAADQDSLSQRFARRGENKFAGLEVDAGVGGIPLLRGCTARFQCRSAFQYEGGDHVIFVGEVQSFDRSDAPPLVFHGGKYAHATRRDPADKTARSAHLAGSFNEDFLGYLLGRSHFLFFARIRKHVAEEHLSDEQFYVLSTLTLKAFTTADEIDRSMAAILGERSAGTLRALVERGLVSEAPVVAEASSAEYSLTARGRNVALQLIAAAKAEEMELMERLGPADGEVMRALLKRMLKTIDPAAAALWGGDATRTAPGAGWQE